MKNIFLLTFTFITTISTLFSQTQKDLEATFQSMSKRDDKIEAYLIENKLFHAKGSPEGIYYIIEKPGEGPKAKAPDYVTVHYRGTLLNGTQFDASYDRNEPISFQLGMGRVIQGWEKGIPLFAKGGKGTLFLTPSLAYGERAIGNIIPANSILKFDIEILDISTQQEYLDKMTAKRLREQAIADSLNALKRAKEKPTIEQYAKDKNLNIQWTNNGLAYVLEKQGDGPKVTLGKRVTVHYTGYLLNGTKFDSSVDRNQPFSFNVGIGQVIQGWDEGLMLLNVGSKAKLIIPSYMGYGEGGAGNTIPPNAILVFDVEVLGVE
jgi:peptidylprolyl isomerase